MLMMRLCVCLCVLVVLSEAAGPSRPRSNRRRQSVVGGHTPYDRRASVQRSAPASSLEEALNFCKMRVPIGLPPRRTNLIYVAAGIFNFLTGNDPLNVMTSQTAPTISAALIREKVPLRLQSSVLVRTIQNMITNQRKSLELIQLAGYIKDNKSNIETAIDFCSNFNNNIWDKENLLKLCGNNKNLADSVATSAGIKPNQVEYVMPKQVKSALLAILGIEN
ncbi:uncharacterized protein LOC120353066 isoform X2 [Nilaparvata lugens]|uniref:uncharacterized protein LOC120353066 isoform X2 n=1 Tax=Nilaparvata lugens TaxID=108931 RepID=UPI00193E33D2|nr:uncharacterized protein LOC120353066 isoform X2 [Nilaparvata lugens]